MKPCQYTCSIPSVAVVVQVGRETDLDVMFCADVMMLSAIFFVALGSEVNVVSVCVCFFIAEILLCGVSVLSLRLWMTSMTL